MSIYFSNNLSLTLNTALENARGLICYENIVDSSTITATSFLTTGSTTFPASNMANPATAFGWEAADNADQTITIDNGSGSAIDYLGIARHNLNQLGLELQVRFNGVVVRPYGAVDQNQALLYAFESATPDTIEIDIRGATEPAKIAVIYVGESTQIERSIYVGHTPIVYGRDRSAFNGVSQSGEYLGEVVTNETLSTTVSLQNLTPDYYRSKLDPYFALKPRRPCFYAWRPEGYPAEVAYCWPEGNPRPVNQRSNGMMSMSWTFRGIA